MFTAEKPALALFRGLRLSPVNNDVIALRREVPARGYRTRHFLGDIEVECVRRIGDALDLFALFSLPSAFIFRLLLVDGRRCTMRLRFKSMGFRSFIARRSTENLILPLAAGGGFRYPIRRCDSTSATGVRRVRQAVRLGSRTTRKRGFAITSNLQCFQVDPRSWKNCI